MKLNKGQRTSVNDTLNENGCYKSKCTRTKSNDQSTKCSKCPHTKILKINSNIFPKQIKLKK